ncbi:MAG: deoxyguanosinetriphosphate triphosphohydrolase [Anaerolineales bacterium]|nr:deoxyguanosinetriphosphate triphosphohydrolase [Anaerolineales bacterium]
MERLENQQLAPYGFRSADSRGRAYPDKQPAYRTAFQRDRDRILHTTAFRRLEYKTQVFVITEGDYYRTRLTHTLEVAQIGRTLARALGANEDLVEAICLAHDLGHTPFGHAGERALSILMDAHGGFNHNTQSLRIVTHLEQRYPDFPGLNLTWEVREGIVKHETEYDISEAGEYEPEKRGHLEAQIANAADETAYTAHDLDDGLRSGLLNPEIMRSIALWRQISESVGWEQGRLDELDRHRLIRRLIGILIGELLSHTGKQLSENKIGSVSDVQNHTANVVGLPEGMQAKNRELKSFLYDHMYRHHRVYRMQVKAERILADLFNAYTEHPAILPEEIQAKAENADFYRVIADYIAGMTDRFALDEHSRLFDPQVNL